MVEVQSHGFTFERWVRDTLFDGYAGDYGQEWDIPADANHSTLLPTDLRGLPVSVKTAGFGTPIGLGDILRQRRIEQPFLMIVGFWRKHSETEKWFEEIGWARFSAESWSGLWGDLSPQSICALDAKVKSHGVGQHEAARLFARNWKKNTPELKSCRIVVNPKIDSKDQRRIQCSLPFKVFWEHAGREPQRQEQPRLFGRTFRNPVKSSPRSFK
ncbi:MAG: hypothetical protein AB1642_11630 [Pseudomonadota bacterium]